MATFADIGIRVTADTKKAVSEFDKLTKKQEEFGKKTADSVKAIGAFGDGVKRHFTTAPSAMEKLSLAIGQAHSALMTLNLAMAGLKVAGSIIDGIDRAFNVFNRTIHENVKTLEKLAGSKGIGGLAGVKTEALNLAIEGDRQQKVFKQAIDLTTDSTTRWNQEVNASKDVLRGLDEWLDRVGPKLGRLYSQVTGPEGPGTSPDDIAMAQAIRFNMSQTRGGKEFGPGVSDTDLAFASAGREKYESEKQKAAEAARAYQKMLDRELPGISSYYGDSPDIFNVLQSGFGAGEGLRPRYEQARRSVRDSSFNPLQGYTQFQDESAFGDTTQQSFQFDEAQANMEQMAEIAGTASTALGIFQNSAAAAFDAFITGSESAASAFKKAIAQQLKATAINAAIKAIESGAHAVYALASGNFPQAGAYGVAAAKYAGLAILAGGASAALGGGGGGGYGGGGGGSGGGGGGASTYYSPGGVGGGNGNITYNIQISSDFVGDADDVASAINDKLRGAERRNVIRSNSSPRSVRFRN